MTRRFVVGHNRSEDGTLSIARLRRRSRGDNPGGGLASSVTDQLRWGRFQAQMSLFTTTPRPQDRLVRGVLDHITANPDGDLRTAVLAANACVSVRHLTRLFREQLGEPPGQLVRRVRIELAARMLASTILPLPQIARACGFSSPETLRQAFVARYHVTPSLLRTTQSSHVQGGGG